MMEKATGASFHHVPFQGTAAAVTQVLGGQIDLVFVTPAFAQANADVGKLIIIGASSAKRLSQAPGIKTLAEQGVAGVESSSWNGLMAPPGTPEDIRRRLNADVNALLQRADLVEKLQQSGHEPAAMSRVEFTEFLASEYARWGRLIRDQKITID